MSRNQKIKNRYSGYGLLPQSVEKDWWLIVHVEVAPNGTNKVYHVCQIVGFEMALSRFKQLIAEHKNFHDSLNLAVCEQIAKEQ